jgi:hypothetical protein
VAGSGSSLGSKEPEIKRKLVRERERKDGSKEPGIKRKLVRERKKKKDLSSRTSKIYRKAL